jgi:hypothetical protein
MKKYKFSDEVSMRVIQIFQEAILLGLDGADLLRQVVVVEDESEPGTLVLDAPYIEMVEKFHEDLLTEINNRVSGEDDSSKSVVWADPNKTPSGKILS